MDPNTLAMMMGASGVNTTPPAPLTAPLLFVTSRSSGGVVYVHGITTSGVLAGTWTSPLPTSYYHAFFYNPFLVVYAPDYSTVYVVDCNTFSLNKTISLPTSAGYIAGWYPWANGVYIGVSSPDNNIYLLDVGTGSVTSQSYTASSGYTGIAQTHMTVGFADNGSTLFSSLKNRYWWSAGQNSGSYPGWYYYADRSGNSLAAASSGFSSGVNYSRTYGLSISSTKAFFVNFGNTYFRVSDTSTTPTQFTPGNLSYAGTTASATLDATHAAPRCTNGSNIYLPYRAVVSTYDYRFTVAYLDPFSSSTPTPTVLPGVDLRNQTTSPSGAYYLCQQGSFMSQVNTSGYVSVAYFDVATNGSTTNVVNVKTYSGSTLMRSATCTLPSAMTAGNNNSSFTELGINGCSWTTNLLYTGTTY